MLARLKGHCVNIYSMLCQNQNAGICRHREPYKCREKYLLSFEDKGQGMLIYMNIPDKILEAHKFRNFNEFREVLTNQVQNWGKAILTYPGAANEVGLILSILYLMIEPREYRDAIAEQVHGLFSSIYLVRFASANAPSLVDLYERMAHGCFVSMLLSDDDTYLEWIKNACIMPRQSESYEPEKIDLLEKIWDDIEVKLETTLAGSIRDMRQQQQTLLYPTTVGHSLTTPDDQEKLTAKQILDDMLIIYGEDFIKDPVDVYIRYYNGYAAKTNTNVWIYALFDILDVVLDPETNVNFENKDVPSILDGLLEGIVVTKYDQHAVRYWALKKHGQSSDKIDQELRDAVQLYVTVKALIIAIYGYPELDVSDVDKFVGMIITKSQPSLDIVVSVLSQ